MADVAAPRGPFRSIWLALPVAVLAGFAGLFVAGPIVIVSPGWLGLSLHSAFIAAIWMIAGGYFAPRTHLALGALFVPGAVLCAWLELGFVHSVSAYYGISTIVMSCLAGALVWLSYARNLPPAASRAAALAVPAATAVVLTTASLLRPGVGLSRVMLALDRTTIPAHVSYAAPAEADQHYVWTPKQYELDSLPVRLELSPGSGDSPYTLRRLQPGTERQAACTAFRESSRSLASGNVAAGAIPAIVTVLPHRQIGCAAGSFWVAEQPRAGQAVLPAHVGSMKGPAPR